MYFGYVLLPVHFESHRSMLLSAQRVLMFHQIHRYIHYMYYEVFASLSNISSANESERIILPTLHLRRWKSKYLYQTMPFNKNAAENVWTAERIKGKIETKTENGIKNRTERIQTRTHTYTNTTTTTTHRHNIAFAVATVASFESNKTQAEMIGNLNARILCCRRH